MFSINRMENLDLAGVFVASWYATTYIVKDPCRTSALTGQEWVEELMEGNSDAFEKICECRNLLFLDS